MCWTTSSGGGVANSLARRAMKIEDVLVQRLQKRKREQAGHCQRGTEDGFKRIEAQVREAKRVRRHEMAATSTSPSSAPPPTATRSWRGEAAAAPGDVACKLVQVQQHRQHQYLLLQIQRQILLAQRHHRRTTAAAAATSSATAAVGCAAVTRRRASLCRQQSTKTTMAAATVKTEKSEDNNENDGKETKKNEESTFGGGSSAKAGLLHFSYPLSSASLSLPFFPSSSSPLSSSASAPLMSTTWLPLPLPAGERCGAVRLPPLVSLFAEPS